DKDTMIVGVVENVAMAPGIDPVAPLTGEETMYLPAAQMEARQLGLLHVWFQPSWIVRTSGPVEGLTGQMQRALASADPNLPCSGALRAMRSVLYGVEVYDVPTILAVVLMLSVVTLLATTVPALRVARIDPAKTLREE